MNAFTNWGFEDIITWQEIFIADRLYCGQILIEKFSDVYQIHIPLRKPIIIGLIGESITVA